MYVSHCLHKVNLQTMNLWSRVNLKCQVVFPCFNPTFFRRCSCRHEPKMSAWQVHSYGGIEELSLSETVRTPKVKNPNEVLVGVCASSVNPIDIAMMSGYGARMFNIMRQVEERSTSIVEFPLSLGRDFSGQVISKGLEVSELCIGDEVWGVIPPHHQGSHAERVVVNKNLVRKKPENLSHTEAGSLLYTAVTAWSALRVTGDLCALPPKGKKVLVLGASGGVGSVAVQLLKAWDAQVVATCRTDAVPLVESLGADCVIDYTHSESNRQIKDEGMYDIILDAAGFGSDKGLEYARHLKDRKFSKYITLTSPLLRNVDSYGLVAGMVKNLVDLAVPNFQTNLTKIGSSVRWGFFIPLPKALEEITCLVESQKITPIVDQVFPFDELPAAFEKLKAGHARGKIVVDVHRRSAKALVQRKNSQQTTQVCPDKTSEQSKQSSQ